MMRRDPREGYRAARFIELCDRSHTADRMLAVTVARNPRDLVVPALSAPRTGEPPMNGSIFDRLRRRVHRARISRVLRPLVGAAIMSAVATGASAEWQSGPFAMACALKETKVITLIEDHGEAGGLALRQFGR